MRFQMVAPSGFLKRYIKYYCFMESDPREGSVSERVVPVENVQLMFHYKKPFAVQSDDCGAFLQPRTIISGLTDSFCDVSTCGEAGVIFVAFHPAAACHFFGFPLSEIENRSIDMADLLGKDIRTIEERLYLEESGAERIELVEGFLRRRFSPVPEYESRLIDTGVELIRRRGGRISAALLADRLAVTTKSLERKFSHYIGKTPKQFIRLIRFQKTLSDFSRNTKLSLTEFAYRNGYFDQSHFIRDFKKYTGHTPKAFMSLYPCCDMDTLEFG